MTRSEWVIAAFGAIILFFAAVTNGWAQRACFSTPRMYSFLNETHGESRVGLGILHGSTGLVEIWANPETGTFTVIVSVAAGGSCVFLSGQNWTNKFPEILEGDPA